MEKGLSSLENWLWEAPVPSAGRWMSAYDPCCGSGGLLIKCHLRLLETHAVEENCRRVLPPQVAYLKLFGQALEAGNVYGGRQRWLS